MRRHRQRVALGLVALLLVGGCGSGGSSDQDTLDVLAAASLTESFTTLAGDFERDHPGVEVRLAFDSSATLAEQVAQGAPADVLATADEHSMSTVVDAGAVAGDPHVFATNRLQLVVPPGNPARITGLNDLERPGVDLVVCVASAPCGRLTATVLERAGVEVEAASEEVDVKAVLSKVQLDEADAGLVYASDAVAARGKVEPVDLPAAEDDPTDYPIAALDGARSPRLARAWVELVLSSRGRQVLVDDGFGRP